MATIVLSDTTVKEVAGTLPKCTEVAPENPEPVIVTAVPTVPLEGLIDDKTTGAKVVLIIAAAVLEL